MMKNWLEKYIAWVDSTGWKTFFKVYGLATLYSLILCLFKSDMYGACLIGFPLNPLTLFIAPLMLFFEFIVVKIPNRIYYDSVVAFYGLITLGIIINLYRFSKQDSLLRLQAKKISRVVKLGLVSYVFIILVFYLGVLITGYDCGYEVCGFLKGYY